MPIRCAHGITLGSPRRCSGSNTSKLERDESLDSSPSPCSSLAYMSPSTPPEARRISGLRRDESLGNSSSSSPSSSPSARDEPESEAMCASSSTRWARGGGNVWWDRDCEGFLGGGATYFSSSLVSLGRAVKRAIS